MTTRNILTATYDHVADLLADYQPKYFRAAGADFDGAPFVLLRFPGSGGESNELLQRIDVLMMLVDDTFQVARGHEAMTKIVRRFRENGTQPGIVRFELLDSIATGPLYLENGRPFWQLNIRVYTQDY